MKIAKFKGATMREALAKVKRELGEDAIVVATRTIRRGLTGTGIEVSAAIDAPTPEQEPPHPAPPPAEPRGLAEDDVERIMAPLRSELRYLRAMMKPVRRRADDSSEVRAELHELRRLLQELQPGGSAATPRPSVREVARRHCVAAPCTHRAIALVGPTGVGKTTTIAKLAARAALIEQEHVAVLTLDNYRVGGEQQLRMFTDLIGVPLYVARKPADLAAKLAALRDYDRLFIDTAGRSPRDLPAIDDLRAALELAGAVTPILVMATNTAARSMDATARRYADLGVERMILTKVDEAHDLAELVMAPARLDLPVSFITTGQAVPEDIEDATTERLLQLATHGFDAHQVAA